MVSIYCLYGALWFCELGCIWRFSHVYFRSCGFLYYKLFSKFIVRLYCLLRFFLFFVLVGYFYIFVHVQHNHNIRGDFGISSMFTNEKRRIDKKREKRSHIAPFITSIDILMHLKTLADLRIRFLLFPYKLFCFVSTFGLFFYLCNIPSTIFVNDLAWFSFYKFYECVILSPLKTVLHAFDIQ